MNTYVNNKICCWAAANFTFKWERSDCVCLFDCSALWIALRASTMNSFKLVTNSSVDTLLVWFPTAPVTGDISSAIIFFVEFSSVVSRFLKNKFCFLATFALVESDSSALAIGERLRYSNAVSWFRSGDGNSIVNQNAFDYSKLIDYIKDAL